MIVNNVANHEIFEFQSDEILAQSVLTDILQSDIHYTENLISSTTKAGGSGYKKISDTEMVCYYNKELFDWIQSCLDEVTKKYFEKNTTLKICDSWVTKTQMGQISHKHKHVLSIFSGLYYLTDHNSSNTIFYFDDPVQAFFSPLLGEHVMPNKEIEFKSKPKIGKLLIWPSYIQHSVEVHREHKVRYTIAFNTFVDGKISSWKSRVLHNNVNGIELQTPLKIPRTS